VLNPPVSASLQFNVASARKSYLGLVVAYAIYEGEMKSLDDLAINYFPELDKQLLGKDYSSTFSNPFSRTEQI